MLFDFVTCPLRFQALKFVKSKYIGNGINGVQ